MKRQLVVVAALVLAILGVGVPAAADPPVFTPPIGFTGLVPNANYTIEADDCAGTPDAFRPGASAPFRAVPGEQATSLPPIGLAPTAVAPGLPTKVKAKAGNGSATVS